MDPDPDPGGPKTNGSCVSGFGSATVAQLINFLFTTLSCEDEKQFALLKRFGAHE
jgi:hypothetical protein